MFTDIGKKLKILAQVMFCLMALGAAIVGLILLATDEELILIGLVVILGGFLAAWVFGMFIYGFGELIDKTCEIERNTRHSDRPKAFETRSDTGKVEPQAQNNITKITNKDRLEVLDDLRSQGLITEEEYNTRRSEIIDKL